MPIRMDEEKVEYPYREMYSRRLKKAMDIRGVDLNTLAKKAGVGESTIRKYLDGIMCPRFRELVRISLALDASIDWMMGRKGCKTLVTGVWERVNEGPLYYFRCSQCGHMAPDQYLDGRNFCENCGAKMRREE